MGHVRFNEPVIAPGFELMDGGVIGAGGDWVFNVQDYGAVADGSTNDTPAIRDAIEAATEYAVANETRYAEVYFPPSPGSYLLSSSPVTTGSGNAQLPLPVVADTARKVTLVLRGANDYAAMPHWLQQTGTRWGTTLRSTLTGLNDGGANGAPSVIGGPTPSQGYGVAGNYNNVLAVVRNIGISLPVGPTLGGIDLRGFAQAYLENVAVIPNGTAAAINAATPASHSFGYLCPNNQNNDLNVLSNFSAYGVATGIQVTEHLTADRVALIYCDDGIYVPAGAAQEHSAWMGTVSIEGGNRGIVCAGFEGARFPLNISALSCEVLSGNTIHDPDNCLHGEIHFTSIDSFEIAGGSNCRLIQANQERGPLTAPAIPATTVALTNPFWVDCDVLVSGGTVTEITIDGVNTGLTEGFFPLRSGGTIALAYSDDTGLTWKWWGH